MRLINMAGLAALAAVAAMAFVGVSSAMAEPHKTALCHNAELVCPKTLTVDETGQKLGQIKLIHMALTEGTVGKMHGSNPSIDILCLSTLAEGHVLGLAEGPARQEIHLLSLTFGGCSSNGGHTNCTIASNASEGNPTLVSVLNEGELLGKATALNGIVSVKCTILGIFKIDCEYEGAGLSFEVESAEHTEGSGNGMLNAEATPLEKLAGGSLCPETSEITEGLLEPLEKPVYLES
jgi:hypothetical protein